MSADSTIQYIEQKDLDKLKWDQCIETAENGLIYCYSFYLDHMARHWDALVWGDYKAVMPLTWNKKFGVKYLYQPFLTAQAGVFGKEVTDELVASFINAIPSSFRFIDIALNNKNLSGSPVEFTTHRSNYILDLNYSYDSIYGNYKENIRRNIKKAFLQGCSIQKDIPIERIIELAVMQMKRHNHDSKENINRFKELYQELQTRHMTGTYGVLSPEHQLLASCVFFFSHRRAYYILVGNHPDGKSAGASHTLIDAFIKDNAGKKIVLDFEGSDIPGLAHFYNSFGAEHEIFPALKINRLPFLLKWLKS